MATILGKRKRQRTPNTAVQVDSDPHSADEADVQAAFRRAFEAKFKPLKTERSKATQPAPSRDLQTAHEEEADSEWSGLSSGPGSDSEDEHLELTDQAGTPTVEIIEHGRNYTRDRHIDRKDHDKFMSARPPSADPIPVPTTKKRKDADPDEDGGEAANLKNDLALQRLLTESHLLETNGSAGSTELVGRNRVKALDLRLEAIGAKKGALTAQQKMPMSLRKGIDGKARERDGKRRTEARENGIILERATGVKAPAAAAGKSRSGPDGHRKRVMDVAAPSIGRFKNGALVLSERDIRSMQSRRGGTRGRGAGRGGGAMRSRGGGRKSK